jgi:hypothetical protein
MAKALEKLITLYLSLSLFALANLNTLMIDEQMNGHI